MLPAYEEPPPPPPRVRLEDVVIPVAAALIVVVASFLFRAPCVRALGNLEFSERHLCYTDIYALYGVEGLDKGRIPYFQERPDGKHVEYPVLTGAWMFATSRISGAIVGADDRSSARGYSTYFWLNQVAFGLLILASAAALGWMAGWKRALLFAAAPTVLFHAGVSWDMLAVAPFVLALFAFTRARDATAGVLLGVGAAAKLYPLFAVPFLAVQRLREGKKREAAVLTAASVGTLVAVNLPVALGAREGWLRFFRLNNERPADWDSIWYHISQTWNVMFRTSRLNVVTALLFAIGAAGLLWWSWSRLGRNDQDAVPGVRRATATGMLLVVIWFLAVNKVWSPQYGIWLLPFWTFAVPLPYTGLVAVWAAFQGMEIFVFVTRFWMFAQRVTYPWFRAAIFLRLAATVALMAFLLSRRLPRAEHEPEAEPAPVS